MVPKDYTYQELVSLLNMCEYEFKSANGSHQRFMKAKDEAKIMVCRPHPGNTMQRYMLRQIIEQLKERGDL